MWERPPGRVLSAPGPRDPPPGRWGRGAGCRAQREAPVCAGLERVELGARTDRPGDLRARDVVSPDLKRAAPERGRGRGRGVRAGRALCGWQRRSRSRRRALSSRAAGGSREGSDPRPVPASDGENGGPAGRPRRRVGPLGGLGRASVLFWL